MARKPAKVLNILTEAAKTFCHTMFSPKRKWTNKTWAHHSLLNLFCSTSTASFRMNSNIYYSHYQITLFNPTFFFNNCIVKDDSVFIYSFK